MRSPLTAYRLPIALLPAAFLAACTTAPERSVPDPLPEVLEWALPAQGAGPFLGLELVENDSGSLEDLSFAAGLRVERVVANSPAQAAGMQPGDVVLAVEDTEVFAPQDVEALVAQRKAGDGLTLEVQRGDTVFDVRTELADAGGDAVRVTPAYHLDPARSQAAWGDAPGGGAVLVARPERGPVKRLPIGTVVSRADDDAVVSGRGLVRRLAALAPGTSLALAGRTPDGSEKTWRVTLLEEGRVVTRASVPVLFTYDADLEADTRTFVVLDLWLISLLRYERDGVETRWRLLRFFEWSSGVGELGE